LEDREMEELEELELEERELDMKIIRRNKVLHNENQPAIEMKGLKCWFMDGKLHRANKPAIETEYGTVQYYWRGVLINKKIAEGELTAKEVMRLENIEQRRCAMERIGYLKFITYMNKIHESDKGMYTLYKMDTEEDEPVVILIMVDPSIGCKYPVRVPPNETNCRLAVAHSYGFNSWEEYKADIWV